MSQFNYLTWKNTTYVVFLHWVTWYLLTAVEECTVFACVWAPPSLTSVLPRVQPEFSRPYSVHLMRMGGRAESLPPGVSPKATYRLTKLWLRGGTISLRVLKCALKSKHSLDVWACDTFPTVEAVVAALGCQCYCCPRRSALFWCNYTGEGRVEQWWTHFFPPVLQWS